MKKFKTAKNAISRKKFDLFDFTSFLAWTFFNFLARCMCTQEKNCAANKYFLVKITVEIKNSFCKAYIFHLVGFNFSVNVENFYILKMSNLKC